MNEYWKDIPSYEGFYQASNLGRIKCIKPFTSFYFKGKSRNNIMKPICSDRYNMVYLSKNTDRKNKYVHRLIAETFIENPNNLPQVNHIDGNRNNNQANNLEWCTASHNQQHAIKTGLIIHKKCHEHKNSKLTKNQVIEIFNYSGKQIDMVRKFNVSPMTVSNIKNKKYWTEVTCSI